jgi:maltose O-acetyltransferase
MKKLKLINEDYQGHVDIMRHAGRGIVINDDKILLSYVEKCDNYMLPGGGSVVTKDLPDNVIAVGNPCRIVREITEDDRDYYFKDRKFDVEDYK